MEKKNVTMSDIAKEIGVSIVSVSKALNGKDGVSESVRKAIQEKAEEMGYKYAKSDKETRARNSIGIIVNEHFISKDAYYSRLYEKAMMMLAEEGQIGLLEIIKRSARKNLEAPALIASDQIRGIIVLGQMSSQYLNMLRKYDIPLLYMDFYKENPMEDAVVSDSVYGSSILTDYLIRNGHKKIAFVGSIYSTSSIMDRYIGYYKAMLLARLKIRPEWLIDDRDEEGNKIELKLPEDMPTAFVCNSDAVAFETIKQLQNKGYSVPEDISVVGFDNFIYSEMSTPKITTYGVDMDAMVQNTVRIILKKIEDKDYHVGRVVVSGTMIERQSVKKII